MILQHHFVLGAVLFLATSRVFHFNTCTVSQDKIREYNYIYIFEEVQCRMYLPVETYKRTNMSQHLIISAAPVQTFHCGILGASFNKYLYSLTAFSTHFTPTIPSKNLSDPGPLLPSHSTPGFTCQSNICICNKLQEKMCTCNIFQLRVCFVPNPLSWSVT